MIDFALADMDAIISRVAAIVVTALKRNEDDAFGRFGWVLGPDGTKIELWEPKKR